MSEKQVIVLIDGPKGSGKTLTAALLRDALIQRGASVSSNCYGLDRVIQGIDFSDITVQIVEDGSTRSAPQETEASAAPSKPETWRELGPGESLTSEEMQSAKDSFGGLIVTTTIWWRSTRGRLACVGRLDGSRYLWTESENDFAKRKSAESETENLKPESEATIETQVDAYTIAACLRRAPNEALVASPYRVSRVSPLVSPQNPSRCEHTVLADEIRSAVQSLNTLIAEAKTRGLIVTASETAPGYAAYKITKEI